MAHFGLDESLLDFIVDDNPLKQGLFTRLPISLYCLLMPSMNANLTIYLFWHGTSQSRL